MAGRITISCPPTAADPAGTRRMSMRHPPTQDHRPGSADTDQPSAGVAARPGRRRCHRPSRAKRWRWTGRGEPGRDGVAGSESGPGRRGPRRPPGRDPYRAGHPDVLRPRHPPAAADPVDQLRPVCGDGLSHDATILPRLVADFGLQVDSSAANWPATLVGPEKDSVKAITTVLRSSRSVRTCRGPDQAGRVACRCSGLVCGA